MAKRIYLACRFYTTHKYSWNLAWYLAGIKES